MHIPKEANDEVKAKRNKFLLSQILMLKNSLFSNAELEMFYQFHNHIF